MNFNINKNLLKIRAGLVILFVMYFPLIEADVLLVKQKCDNCNIILYSGEIKKGDFDKTIGYLKLIYETPPNEIISGVPYRYFSVQLDSIGGDVSEALKIGLLLRKFLVSTLVDDLNFLNAVNPVEYEGKCYSSCVFILLGGIEKLIFSMSNSKKTGIGVHRHFYRKADYSHLDLKTAKAKYQDAEFIVKQYLKEMGASEEFIEFIYGVSSNNLVFLSKDQVKKWIVKTPPFYEELVISKCGVISKQEWSDIDTLDINMFSIKKRDGYRKYLFEKLWEIDECKKQFVMEERDKVFKELF